MNIQEQTKMIEQFHAEGKSIRRIAKELGISKSHVHRIISETGTPTRDSPVPPSQQDCPSYERDNKTYDFSTNESKNETKPNTFMDSQDMLEIEMKRLELEHQIQMRKLEMQEEELKLRKMEIESRSKGDTTLIEKQKQEERVLTWELQEFFKEEASLCNSKGNVTISYDNAEEKNETVKELKQKLAKYCVKFNVNKSSTPYYENLEVVYSVIKKELDKYEDNDDDNNEDDDDDDEDDIEITYTYRLDILQKIKQLAKSESGLVFELNTYGYSYLNYKKR
jgi:AraC-like DNA-binding protein